MHDYANAVIQGQAYRPDDAEASAAKTEKGDLGVEVARLNYAIDDVTRQLRQEVSILEHPLSDTSGLGLVSAPSRLDSVSRYFVLDVVS